MPGRSSTQRNTCEAFRLDHAAIAPGGITYEMALPWQADFNACGDNWWPVPRPNDVIPQGQTSAVKWSRTVGSYEDMVAKWHSLGFVVRQGNQHVEVDRCDTATITLLTPTLNFHDVPQGPMGMVRETALAITFEVISPSARRHARLRARRGAVPCSAGGLQHCGHGRADGRQCGGDRAALGDLPHRRRRRDPDADRHRSARGNEPTVDHHDRSATRWRARPPPPRSCSIARAAWPKIAAMARASTCRCNRPPPSSST